MQIPGADGCIIQPMMKGYELIVGAKRDTTFGPIVAIGLGGVLTELISNPILMSYPFTYEQFSKQVLRKKWHALFDGFRGEKKIDLKKLYSVAYGVGELMQSSLSIAEIDINPLIMSGNDFFAVDVRIVI